MFDNVKRKWYIVIKEAVKLAMINKGIRVNEDDIKNLEKVASNMNKEAGTDLYDFSQLVRIAINRYLNSEDIEKYWKEGV